MHHPIPNTALLGHLTQCRRRQPGIEGSRSRRSTHLAQPAGVGPHGGQHGGVDVVGQASAGAGGPEAATRILRRAT